MNRDTHVGCNAKGFRGIAIRPALSHLVTEQRTTLNGALTQRVAPGNAQPLRDLHLLAVAGVEDMLQPRIDIDLRQVGGLHFSHNLQHLQQLADETFKGLLSGERF